MKINRQTAINGMFGGIIGLIISTIAKDYPFAAFGIAVAFFGCLINSLTPANDE